MKAVKYNQIKTIITEIAGRSNRYLLSTGDAVRTEKTYNVKDVDNHLMGLTRYGIYPEVTEDTCSFGAIDFDLTKEMEDGSLDEAGRFAIAIKVKSYLQNFFRLRPVLEISKSGGVHIFVFFNDSLDREFIQWLLSKAITETVPYKICNGSIEVFPKGSKGAGIFFPFFNMFNSQKEINDSFFENKLSCVVYNDAEPYIDFVEEFEGICEHNSKELPKWKEFKDLPPCVFNSLTRWKPGTRDGYACGLAGVLKRHVNYTAQQAASVIDKICSLTDDEESVSRQQVLSRTYKLEQYKGCGILQGKDDSITVFQNVCSSHCQYLNKQSGNAVNDEKVFIPNRICEAIQEKYKIITESGLGNMYIYEESTGLWSPRGELFIQNALSTDYSWIPNERFRTSANINKVIELLRFRTYPKQGWTDIFDVVDSRYIPFKNGVFDLNTGLLLNHSPDFHLVHKLPWNYNPRAKMNFLNKVMRGFVKSDEYVTDLYEMLAYCFWRENISHPFIFYLEGSGSNGKSLFMKVVEMLFGKENFSALDLKSLSDKFMQGQLRNKWINIGGEVGTGSVIEDSNLLKKVSAGDSMTIDQKFKDQITLRNYAKLIFFGNGLPAVSDTGDALYRRLFIIPFGYKYRPSTHRPDSSEIIKVLESCPEEMEALAYKCLQVLIDLKRRRFTFTHHPDAHKTRERAELDSEPALLFMKDFCVRDHNADSMIPKAEFQERLEVWLEKMGKHNRYKNYSLRRLMYDRLNIDEISKEIQVNKTGVIKRYQLWVGIRWKTGDDLVTVQVDESPPDDIWNDWNSAGNKPTPSLGEKTSEAVIESDYSMEDVTIIEPDNVLAKTMIMKQEDGDFMIYNKPLTNSVGVMSEIRNTTLVKLLEDLKGTDIVSLDLETFGEGDKGALDPKLNHIRLITLGIGDDVYSIDTFNYTKEELYQVVYSLKEKCIVGHNLKFDLSTLAHKFGQDVLPENVFDTMLAAKLLYFQDEALPPIKGTLSLKGVAKKYLGADLDKTEQNSNWGWEYLSPQQIEYAAMDVKILKPLMTVLVEKLNTSSKRLIAPDSAGLKDFVSQIEMKFLTEVIKMEMNGIPVNIEVLNRAYDEAFAKMAPAYKQIKELYNIDPNSIPQTLTKLQNMGIIINDTSDEELCKHVEQPLVRLLRTYREEKKESDLIKGFTKVSSDGRLYTTFNSFAANTGRMSAAGPNVQQIPHSVKDSFYLPPEGRAIVSADYPGIELRLCAEIAQDSRLIESFKNNTDNHRNIAASMFNKAPQDVTKDERAAGKNVNFGFIYGCGAKSFVDRMLQKGIKFTSEQGELFKSVFLSSYVGVKVWQKDTGSLLRQSTDIVKFRNKSSGEMESRQRIQVRSILGRIIKADSFNDALNYQVQSSGADMTKLAVLYLRKNIKEFGLQNVKLISIIHDDIVLECDDSDKQAVEACLKLSMEMACNLIIKSFHTEV